MITDEKLELLDKIYTASSASKNAYANACHFALGAIPELITEIRRLRDEKENNWVDLQD